MTPNDYAAHLFVPAEAALASLRRHGVAPSVEHYAIWFTHHAGYNPALSRMIKLLEASNDPFDETRHRELYDRFLARADGARMLHETAGRADAALGAVSALLEELQRDATGYGAALDDASRQLTGERLAELAGIVARLRVETTQMRDRTETLQGELTRRNEEIGALRFELERAEQAVSTDPLTGIGNRRLFDKALRHTVVEAVENGEPLSLLLLDIDHFKQFNDTFGHQVGDLVLRLVAGKLKDSVKGRDLPARYGGEEFAILLPHTPLSGAAALAEQIRGEIAARRVQLKGNAKDLGVITLSIGAATYRPGESLTAFVERADQALYAAKRAGRNRVVVEAG